MRLKFEIFNYGEIKERIHTPQGPQNSQKRNQEAEEKPLLESEMRILMIKSATKGFWKIDEWL